MGPIATPEDYTAEIAPLERLLNGGITSGNTDGLSVTFDLVEVRGRLPKLKSVLPTAGVVADTDGPRLHRVAAGALAARDSRGLLNLPS